MDCNKEGQAPAWLKITIRAESVLVEPISDFLMGLTEAGVEIGVDDHDSRQTINMYLAQADIEDSERENILTQIGSYLDDLAKIFHQSVPTVTVSQFVAEDWSNNWKKHFTPFAIVPGVVIAPTWEHYLAQPGEIVIEMDPGMAFGTGHHATTSLSLSLVKEVVQAGGDRRVLDVGTGTGILGMAAALFGAAAVLAIDNDPEAVSAALTNVEHNNLATIMEVSAIPLEDVTGQFSLVVANIIHDTLLELAETLSRLTENGGALVLSGILQGQQTENIIRCFAGKGFRLARCEQLSEWSALLLRKEEG
jgi:ribosomal protein L11 methyltransferase